MNSCEKGKRGEREWAAYLRDVIGCEAARRGRQYSGSPESPDVVGGIPGTHVEVKRVEHLNLSVAMRQAEADAGDAIPYVAHRRNREPWLITLRACDVLDFAAAVARAALDESDAPAPDVLAEIAYRPSPRPQD